MKLFNVGDVVLYSTGGGLKTYVGLILKHKENGNYVVLSQFKSVYKDIRPEYISALDDVDKVRKEVINKYDDEINAIQSQIRKVTQEEKEQEKITKYREIQRQIKVVAKRLSESTDDADFENKLKAISYMKEDIFSIKLECVSNIRKKNGRLKYEIKELEKNKNAELKRISDENINKAFDFV